MQRSLTVITGAAGALGRAVAAVFRESGARLVLVDVDERALDALYARDGGESIRVAADLTDQAASGKALGKVFAEHGPATALCNIAGGFDAGAPVHETTAQTWQRMQDLNVATLINASLAAILI